MDLYHQVFCKPIGERGQKILSTKRVLIIGWCALDYVDLTDFQRQILIGEDEKEARSISARFVVS
ncbi:MAG TPA: hypothetical protein EYP58_01075 [bacterium (Candidatus Stahlbacteria)]|nr:hypothetical protein [Candidatus Stahlbacteria bacterium]